MTPPPAGMMQGGSSGSSSGSAGKREIKRADKRTSITILVLGDEGVGKSSLISTFVSRYFSEVVPGIMTRVRLPPDKDTGCVTTIVDSQGGDAALAAAVADFSTTSSKDNPSLGSTDSLANLLGRVSSSGNVSVASGGGPATPSSAKTSSPGAATGQGGTAAANPTASSSNTGGGAMAGRPISAAGRAALGSSAMSARSATSGAGSGATGGIENVDSIILVYDLDRKETFFRLENHWLPLIERCYQGKVPVIVAGNKDDLYRPSSSASTMDEQALARNRQQILSMLQRFTFVRQHFKCSAKNLLRLDDIFIKAQQAVIYPFTPPLYDLKFAKFTVEAKTAFARIFRMFDKDHDSLLSEDELDRFQRETYRGTIFNRDFTAWKKIVTRNNPGEVVIKDEKFTFSGFCAIFDVFVNQNRLDVVWQALRKYGYDDDLNLHVPDSVCNPTNYDDFSGGWKLSSQAQHFLKASFRQFDSDKDGILSPDDLAKMLSILPYPALPPWHPLRRAELFGDAFSLPICDGDHELLAASTGSTESPLPGQLIVPGAASTSGQPILSESGTSILSDTDLPSVSSGNMAVSQPLTLLEWMGQWHLISSISSSVARSELFRLGHVEEFKSKKHESSRQHKKNWKRSVAPFTSSTSGDKAAPTASPDAKLPSREIRVLVMGSHGSGKTALINHLRRAAATSSRRASPLERMLTTTSPTDTTCTLHPETSTTFIKLKRQSKSNAGSKRPGAGPAPEEEEEFVIHLIFTDVPETAAASQEEHYRELTELFGTVTSPNDRVCDLAMLVFDCTDSTSLMYVKELESNFLTKETPRFFVGTKVDTVRPSGAEVLKSPVVVEAMDHCRESDLEGPLLVSAKDPETGADRARVLEHVVRCALDEPGFVRLKSKPHEEQKRQEAARRMRMMWLGGTAVCIGVVVVIVAAIWCKGGTGYKKNGERKNSGGSSGVGWWLPNWFAAGGSPGAGGGGAGSGGGSGDPSSADAAKVVVSGEVNTVAMETAKVTAET